MPEYIYIYIYNWQQTTGAKKVDSDRKAKLPACFKSQKAVCHVSVRINIDTSSKVWQVVQGSFVPWSKEKGTVEEYATDE